MKKINLIKIIVVLMFLTFLCGCWNVNEINQRALPLAIGISKENEEEFKVTLYIPVTSVEGKTRIVTEKGESVSSVLGRMRTNSEGALDYSKIQFIVIQNHLANNNQEWSKLIKYLMKSREIPSIALLAITEDDIEKMFAIINEKKGFRATSIYDYFYKGAGWAPEFSITRVWEVYRSLFSYTKDIAVPVVKSGKDTVFIFEDLAVLKNGKITGRISPSENLLVNLFQNRNARGQNESLGFASIRVINSSLQIRPSMKNNEPLVSSDLNVKIDILEREEGVTNSRILKELEKLMEKRFNDMFEQAQRNKTDIFGFGQHFRHQIPYHELKDWREEYYPKLKVNFQVHVSME
ncbi:Ger(x)C family spore germination protein [Bacillus sp. FJAT-28004]|uniref:Ger(x)C family spore germination protein n=1 Tax=Bacillus sp. FJAT-28004 TaxID=1679165 RepID=UPI0006B40685|nr:Ger(x)C family spore germination protein [Bacillus sp. FJAT-28004]